MHETAAVDKPSGDWRHLTGARSSTAKRAWAYTLPDAEEGPKGGMPPRPPLPPPHPPTEGRTNRLVIHRPLTALVDRTPSMRCIQLLRQQCGCSCFRLAVEREQSIHAFGCPFVYRIPDLLLVSFPPFRYPWHESLGMSCPLFCTSTA